MCPAPNLWNVFSPSAPLAHGARPHVAHPTHPTRTHVSVVPTTTVTTTNVHRKATNISGMDVAPSRVVVCSADTAWYYDVPQASGAPQHHQERREHLSQSQSQSQQRRIHPSRDEASSSSGINQSTAGGRQGQIEDIAGSVLESSSGAAAVAAAAVVSPASALRGFRLPSSCMTEARFSGDEERCFFGSMSGDVYVVGPVGSRLVPSARTHKSQDMSGLPVFLAFPLVGCHCSVSLRRPSLPESSTICSRPCW